LTTNAKLALAMAVPAVALFVGAMSLHGPGARLEGARSRARRRKGPRARRRRGYPKVGDFVEVRGKGNAWYRVKVNDGVRADGRFEALPWAVKASAQGRDWRFAGADSRVYWVDYVEAYAPNRPMTMRIVADTRLSKAELRAKLLERDVSPDMKITKVRSEAI
jgi:hypothetical protein